MSSHQTDIQALKAKIARLEAELEVEREQSEQAGSRIKELEQKVKQLEIDKRLSTPKLNDRATQRGLSTDASDPAQRAETSQLRDELVTKDAELATKDAELATKDATIEQLFEAVSFLRRSLIGYMTNRNQAKEGMRSVEQCWKDIMDSCDTDDNDILAVYEQTRQFERPIFVSEQDNATSPLPEDTGSSGSRATNFAREGASWPPQPSPKLTTAELAADAASGPPRLPPWPTAAEPAVNAASDPFRISGGPSPKNDTAFSLLAEAVADATSDLLRISQISPTATKPTADRTSEPPQPSSASTICADSSKDHGRY